jgi:hypothetical protein
MGLFGRRRPPKEKPGPLPKAPEIAAEPGPAPLVGSLASAVAAEQVSLSSSPNHAKLPGAGKSGVGHEDSQRRRSHKKGEKVPSASEQRERPPTHRKPTQIGPAGHGHAGHGHAGNGRGGPPPAQKQTSWSTSLVLSVRTSEKRHSDREAEAEDGAALDSATRLQREIEALQRDNQRLRQELGVTKATASIFVPPSAAPPHHSDALRPTLVSQNQRYASDGLCVEDPRWDVEGFAFWATEHAPFVRAGVLRDLLRQHTAQSSSTPCVFTVPPEALQRNFEDMEHELSVAGVRRFVVLTSYFGMTDPQPLTTLREILRVLNDFVAKGDGSTVDLVYWDQLALEPAQREDARSGGFYRLFCTRKACRRAARKRAAHSAWRTALLSHQRTRALLSHICCAPSSRPHPHA